MHFGEEFIRIILNRIGSMCNFTEGIVVSQFRE